MKYRPEIDGLRTIAVVPVILFHAGFGGFSGGFVGVDIFFVISGYLITTILINEHDEGRFSLINFYERRARRILPALFFVILCCLPFAWMWLLPDDFVDFGKSLLATALFSSNIYFWMDSGYFATANELKPLLHTWSLAVEEQFYIFFPLALMLFWRFGKRFLVGLLILAFVVSLGISHWAAYHKPDANFYLLPTRAWELLIGSFCAFWLQKRALPTASPITQLLGISGLGLIVYSIIFFDGTTPFPSLYALAPTVGTALIILFATKGTITSALLSLKPMVGVGLISYSAYLWHQPIFAFARHRSLLEPSHELMLGLSILSLALAYFSWKFVEAPFRNKKRVSRTKIFSMSGVGIVVSIVFAGSSLLAEGFSVRFGNRLSGVNSIATVGNFNYLKQPKSNCTFHFDAKSPPKIDLVRLGVCQEREQLAYLIGDSHAASLRLSLEAEFELRNWSLISITMGGCIPVPGVSRKPFSDEVNTACRSLNETVHDILASNNKPVIMSSRWRLELEGYRYDNGQGGVEWGGGDWKVYVASDEKEDVVQYISTYLSHLSQSRKVVVVDQIPEAGWHVPNQMIKRLLFTRDSGSLSTSLSRYNAENRNVFRLMTALRPFSSIVDTSKLICNQSSDRCANELHGKPLYTDDNHPSVVLSDIIATEIWTSLQED